MSRKKNVIPERLLPTILSGAEVKIQYMDMAITEADIT